MRLLAPGFVALPLPQLQTQMKRIPEDYESMNHDPITRRSKERGDIRTAFGSANAYAQMLKAPIREAASNQQRRDTANLIAQCELLLTILSWHFINLETAAHHVKEAVEYGELSGDIPLHLYALKQQAWMHYYSQRGDKAVKAIGQATLVLKEHKNSLSRYTHSNIYSALAVMQASNGQDARATLRYAEKMLHGDDAPVYVDPPIPAFIQNIGMTLYEQGDYGQAMIALEQLIDKEQLTAKQPMPERGRVEIINIMTLTPILMGKETSIPGGPRTTPPWPILMVNIYDEGERPGAARSVHVILRCRSG